MVRLRTVSAVNFRPLQPRAAANRVASGGKPSNRLRGRHGVHGDDAKANAEAEAQAETEAHDPRVSSLM